MDSVKSKLVLFFFSCCAIVVANNVSAWSQSVVLVVGTMHRTANERVGEFQAVHDLVERFHPDEICVEYPAKNDTASWLYRGTQAIYKENENFKQAWQVPIDNPEVRINKLERDPELASNIEKQMRLWQLYFLTFDRSNAEYLGFRIMTEVERTPEKGMLLRDKYSGFFTMKGYFEGKMGRIGNIYINNEYYKLVFPLAMKLKIGSLFSIDDLSDWPEHEKFQDQVASADSSDAAVNDYKKMQANFVELVHSFRPDSSLWLHINTTEMITQSKWREVYWVSSGVQSPAILGMQALWIARNRKMAVNIAAVVRRKPTAKIAVFVGAAHVGPIIDELRKILPNQKIFTLTDIR